MEGFVHSTPLKYIYIPVMETFLSGFNGWFTIQFFYRTPTVWAQFLIGHSFIQIKHRGKSRIGFWERHSHCLNVLSGMNSRRSEMWSTWCCLLSAVDWTVARGRSVSRNPCVTRGALAHTHTHTTRCRQPHTQFCLLKAHTSSFGLVMGPCLKPTWPVP